MDCIICNSSMSRFFSKKFTEFGLGKVNYYKCKNCGFVQAKEIIELERDEWEKLNTEFHNKYYYNQETTKDPNRISRLNKQADFLKSLVEDKLLSNGARELDYAKGDWLDYACGDGELIRLLSDRHIFNIDGYEPYSDDYKAIPKFDYGVVISTSYLEHARKNSDIFWLEKQVKLTDGALAFSTVICSEFPDDPDWFYYWPVHCSFFTNRAAEILFDRWNYQSCIYSPDARMWVWFKKQLDPKDVPDYYLFKQNGFLGYW